MTEKLKMHTKNRADENFKALLSLFPNAVTETIDENGVVVRAIDKDVLMQEISVTVVEGRDERYQFTWPDKRKSVLLANSPISKTLRPCREESVDFDTTQNLYIEGDNLDVLKLLQETYLGKIKMIYIDPPYNTGHDFVYEDHFAQSADEYLANSGQFDDEGNRLVANTESNGRFHTDWLNMMYPRLRIARDLLTDDGVIFISIDDKEASNLKKICDEIFGETNFRSDISWQKRYTRSNNTIDFTTVIEHIFVYSRSMKFIVNLLPRTKEADNRYTNPDNDPRGLWKGASFLNPATPKQRPNLCYPITNPNTGTTTYPSTNAWRRSKEIYEVLLAENRLYWGLDGKSPIPSVKMYLSEARGLTPTNFWEHEYAGNTDEGTANLAGLMGLKVFENPKPIKLIIRVLEHATSANGGDIILDFFSGSATTAHAVMQLNAEDRGNRKFIMVQIPEKTGETSEAFKAGYTTISDIGKERIRRAGTQIKNELRKKATGQTTLDGDSPVQNPDNLDIGFRVLKLDTTNMEEVFYTPEEYTKTHLAGTEDNIKKDRTQEDLLFQVMLELGVPLSGKITTEKIDECEVFSVEDNYLYACFDDNISDTVIKAIAEKKPYYAVFRDSGMANDAVLTNFDQIFAAISPTTKRKVL